MYKLINYYKLYLIIFFIEKYAFYLKIKYFINFCRLSLKYLLLGTIIIVKVFGSNKHSSLCGYIDKVSDSYIRHLGFNFLIHQKLISVLI